LTTGVLQVGRDDLEVLLIEDDEFSGSMDIPTPRFMGS